MPCCHLVAFTLLTSPLAAQQPARTAVVDVRVLDQSGAAVTDAEVLVARGSESPRAAPAVDPGRYLLSGLLPGRYVITVAKAGFAAISVEAAAYVGRTVTVPVILAPAGLTDLVTVEAVAPAGSTAYKLPATLHETPRSLTIIDAARMREQNFHSVPDALAYVPGIFVNSYRAEGYHFYARGYRMGPEDTRIDGFAGINAGGGFGASLFGVEQAVVLRGPAGLLYGSAGSPGGLINLITKKPLDLRRTRLDVRTGGYAGSGVTLGDRGTAAFDLDSTGPLTRDGRVLYRALVTTENASYFTNDVVDRNRYANASITWRLDRHGRVTLTPIAQWSRLNRPAGGGIVVSPSTSLSVSDGVASPIDVADLSPHDVNLSSGGRIDETFWTGADLRAQATRALTLNASYRFIRFDTDIDQFTPQVTTAAQIAALRDLGLVQRVHRTSGNQRRYHNLDVNGTYELRPGGSWKSLVQVGLNGRLATLRATGPAGPTPGPQSPLDVYTGETLAPLVPDFPALAWGAPTDDGFWNTYVQNQTSLAGGKVVATIGLGYGENDPAVGAVRTSDVMPNAALVVNATRSLALFGSYATSYN
ncbi:MAG: TonB-dependent receptor, partial [Vicinamibacteria bacterium]|nr:TonB-dependent receptor [Vicinamibacteria bacterium]